MKARHLSLALVLAVGMAVVSPAHVLADDCPDNDAPDACADAMPASDGPDGVPNAPDVTVPSVDASGDPIPYVEENTDTAPLSP